MFCTRTDLFLKLDWFQRLKTQLSCNVIFVRKSLATRKNKKITYVHHFVSKISFGNLIRLLKKRLTLRWSQHHVQDWAVGNLLKRIEVKLTAQKHRSILNWFKLATSRNSSWDIILLPGEDRFLYRTANFVPSPRISHWVSWKKRRGV